MPKDDEILEAYKIGNNIVLEFIKIDSSLAVTIVKKKDYEDGTLLVNLYFIDKRCYKQVNSWINNAIEKLISNYKIINLKNRIYNVNELNRYINILS